MTVNTSSNKILNNLNSILSKRQRERENMVTMLTGAIAMISKTREERDQALAKTAEVERKFHTASEVIRELNAKYDRLQRDMNAMVEAVELATHQFSLEEENLTNQLSSFNTELGKSINVFPNLSKDNVFVERASYAARPQANDIPQSPMSIDNDESGAVLRNVMDELNDLLNKK